MDTHLEASEYVQSSLLGALKGVVLPLNLGAGFTTPLILILGRAKDTGVGMPMPFMEPSADASDALAAGLLPATPVRPSDG